MRILVLLTVLTCVWSGCWGQSGDIGLFHADTETTGRLGRSGLATTGPKTVMPGRFKHSRKSPALFMDPGNTSGSRRMIIPPNPHNQRPYNPELDEQGYPKPHIRLLDQKQ